MRLTGKTLKEQRLAMGASQAEMAKRAGISRPTIIRYEKGIDLQLANILDAYCLEVYPTVGSLPASAYGCYPADAPLSCNLIISQFHGKGRVNRLCLKGRGRE